MKPYLQIHFPTTGHTYEVPTSIIARGMDAAGLAAVSPDLFAYNAMTWDQIEPHAKLISVTPPPRDMLDAEVIAVDFPTSIPRPNTGSAILDSTVAQLLSAATDSTPGVPYSNYVIQDEDGTATVLVSLVFGHAGIVDAAVKHTDAFANAVNRLINAFE